MRKVLALTALLLVTPLMAETIQEMRVSSSVSYLADEKKVADLRASEADTMPPLKRFGFRYAGRQPEKTIQTRSCGCDGWIFDATTTLLSDVDRDGFYHRFKIAINADTDVYRGQWVYAKLFLSFEGGPWNHYATSADFHIDGHTSLDEFVVETELSEGYPAGYYDARIELYDADSEAWLDTYDALDDSSLSAIPLEDAERDRGTYEYGVYATGSMGGTSLFLLAVLGLWRVRHQSGFAR